MSLDINALNVEIYTKLNVSAITSLLGKTPKGKPALGHFKIPQDSTYPIVTYFVVIDVQGDTFTEWGSDALVQIDVWSDSNSAAESGEIVEAIAAQMDDKTLNISGYNKALAIRQNMRLLYESETGRFHQVMEYSVRWSKTK